MTNKMKREEQVAFKLTATCSSSINLPYKSSPKPKTSNINQNR